MAEAGARTIVEKAHETRSMKPIIEKLPRKLHADLVDACNDCRLPPCVDCRKAWQGRASGNMREDLHDWCAYKPGQQDVIGKKARIPRHLSEEEENAGDD